MKRTDPDMGNSGYWTATDVQEASRPFEKPAAVQAIAPEQVAASTIFKEKAGRHLPGEEGVWLFILGDLVIFGLFFVTFVVYRSWQPELYAASQLHMNQTLGVVNTLLLLSSSWAVASALHRAKSGLPGAPALLGLAIAMGIGFGIVKYFEYSEKIRVGITLNSNEFYTFYYMFTGTHLLHVTMGVGVLAYLFLVAKKDRLTASDIRTLEGGASFWHLVDILWIVLFALFYLMR